MTRYVASIQFTFDREIEIFADSLDEAENKARSASCSELQDAEVDVVFDVREEE